MGATAKAIQKMQDRLVRNIRWHMEDGKSYADACAIVRAQSVAGPAVWARIDSLMAEEVQS